MNTHVISFNNLLASLDCTGNLIKITSEAFIEHITHDLELGQDLVKLILFNAISKETNSLKYIYLTNEIVIKIYKLMNNGIFKSDQQPTIKEILEGLLEVLGALSESSRLGDKEKKEMEKILSIWNDKRIFNSLRITEIKLNLVKHLDYPLTSFYDKAFLTLYQKDIITIPKNIQEYNELINTYTELNNKSKLSDNNEVINSCCKQTEPEKMNTENQEEVGLNRLVVKKKLVKKSIDLVNIELENHKNKIEALRELDSIIANIDSVLS